MDNYQPKNDLLRDRVILVTGAGEGLGRAAATTFARFGASVVLLGRTMPRLEETYDLIEGAGSPCPAIFPLNLENASAQEHGALVDTIEREFGRLDGILHNAAQLALLSRIDDYDPEIWNRVLQVNLTAPFLLTQASLPLLRQAGDASVLFTSDRVGRVARAYWGAYGVSKFALEGLMRILAEETRDSSNIRFNSVAPGPARTNLRAHAYPGEDPASVPPPEAYMSTYLYLMGPDSRGITGQAFDAVALSGDGIRPD